MRPVCPPPAMDLTHPRWVRHVDPPAHPDSARVHSFHGILALICTNVVRSYHMKKSARRKILDHALGVGRRAALGSRTPDLRITRDVIAAYTVRTRSIGARRRAHGAQRRRR